MQKIKEIWKFIRKNERYCYVFLVIGLIFLINKSFPAEIITSESCTEGNCPTSLESPSLTDKEPVFFVNDIFNSKDAGYYRLTFQTKSNQNSKIKISITNALDESKELKSLEVIKSTNDNFQEILFSTENLKTYTDILFEKENSADGAEITVAGVQVSKLNISNEKEFANFKPTIRGEISFDIPGEAQTINSGYFNQLIEPGIILGEVFQSDMDYITGVTLDFDIIKQSNNGGKKYNLDLREVEYYEGGVPEVKSDILSNVDFTIDDLVKYRQEDGKYKFPLFAKIEKGNYYFIGINNDKIDVNKFNYLRLKGNSDGEKYKNGLITVKNKGQSYSQSGDLYFQIYGTKFNEYQGKKVLRGETIEDLGKQKGIFKYQPRNDIYDLADLDSFTPDINIDEKKKVINGSIIPKKESVFIYKFETIFPATKFRIFAKQPDINWSKVSIFYSFDKNNWIEIPSIEANEIISSEQEIKEIQVFNFTFSETIPKDTIYIKITQKNQSFEEKKYGIKDFRFEADLIMK